jgi:tetratricopeptide (TPR) repeat protein
VKKQRNKHGATAAAGEARAAVNVQAPRPEGWRPWQWLVLALGALLVTFEVYSGALSGPFLLDDLYLPFGRSEAPRIPLEAWISRRPLVGLSFYWNYKVSGTEPYTYHAINVFLHWITSVLAFLVLRKMLELAGEQGRRRDWLALAGGAVFLLHPVQTQAVAYIVSRSDVMCTLFLFASLLVFLQHRTPSMGFLPSLVVLVLFGCAVLAKEQAAVLPAVFVLIDVYWREGAWWQALRKNWKLYAPMALGGVFGLAVIRQTLMTARTAGFGMKDLTWWDYFLTQCRVLWIYFRLTVLPFGQNVDHDIPVSRTLMDHGAAIGMVALAALVGAAWWFRTKYPLVLFGLLTALLLFSPTSSLMPIRDVIAEHRLYAPLLGLLLIGLEFARRLRFTRAAAAALGAVLLALGYASHARASLYGSDIAIWADSVEKSPNKVRPRFQLAYAYMQKGQCAEADREFSRTAQLAPPDMTLLVDWALTLDCLGRTDEALAKLQEALKIEPAANVYAQIGMMHGKKGRNDEALAVLDQAIKMDPLMIKAYVYRGNVLGGKGEWAKAIEEYKKALSIDPSDPDAIQNMRVAEQQLQQRSR